MFEILQRRQLAPAVCGLRVHAPLTARHAQAGQFCVVRSHADAERIPLTLANWSAQEEWVEVVVQQIGEGTARLAQMTQGQALSDLLGPLGVPSELPGGLTVCVAGGVGAATLQSYVRALYQAGAPPVVILGARNAELLILQDELHAHARSLLLCTDDGSAGRKGLVTDALAEVLTQYEAAHCFCVGPLPMMRAVCALTAKHGLATTVSLNPIMVDGTGMCGCCRVEVGGQVRYACVDGPDFDGHAVNWALMATRAGAYRASERAAYERHVCQSGIHAQGGCP